MSNAIRFDPEEVLKRDLFGRIERGQAAWSNGIRRDAIRRNASAAPLWIRVLSVWLARREAHALRVLGSVEGVPSLLCVYRGCVIRSWIEGVPMQMAAPRDPEYHAAARRLVARLHRAGVAHNDLAKEPNWLVTPDGRPALVDLQIAWVSRRRGPLFRAMAREDLRHLLKHKRKYCRAALTDRERRILATPLWVTRALRVTVKRAYNFVTRRIFRWTDSEGKGWRGSR